MSKNIASLTETDHSRLIEMAWEDRTPFEVIAATYGLNQASVIRLMPQALTGSFRLLCQRISGRKTKHRGLRNPYISRVYCPSQYKHR